MFCDTSTLAKYYIEEAESAAVRARMDEVEEVTLCALARVELMSVFHRCWREGIWSRAHFMRAATQLRQDELRRMWTWVPLDEAIIEYSSNVYLQLPDNIFLRASDCLHIATALRSNYLEIYTHDQRQAKAAEALGLNAMRIA